MAHTQTKVKKKYTFDLGLIQIESFSSLIKYFMPLSPPLLIISSQPWVSSNKQISKEIDWTEGLVQTGCIRIKNKPQNSLYYPHLLTAIFAAVLHGLIFFVGEFSRNLEDCTDCSLSFKLLIEDTEVSARIPLSRVLSLVREWESDSRTKLRVFLKHYMNPICCSIFYWETPFVSRFSFSVLATIVLFGDRYASHYFSPTELYYLHPCFTGSQYLAKEFPVIANLLLDHKRYITERNAHRKGSGESLTSRESQLAASLFESQQREVMLLKQVEQLKIQLYRKDGGNII